MSSQGRCQDAVWSALEHFEVDPTLERDGRDIIDALVEPVYDIAFEQGRQQAVHDMQVEINKYRSEAWEAISEAARQLHAIAYSITGQQHRVPPVFEKEDAHAR